MVNFTPANLQRAGEGALFPKNSKLMNELAGAVLKENKNEVKYDLLDDETGAVTGTLSDFETAYALETLNKEFDSSYVPSIHKSNNGNSYAYDTDRDGKWDTHVLFNDNGELVNHTSYGQEATLDIYYNYLSATQGGIVENPEDGCYITYTQKDGDSKLYDRCVSDNTNWLETRDKNFMIRYADDNPAYVKEQ